MILDLKKDQQAREGKERECVVRAPRSGILLRKLNTRARARAFTLPSVFFCNI